MIALPVKEKEAKLKAKKGEKREISEAHRQAIIAANKGRKGRKLTDEHKAKISAGVKKSSRGIAESNRRRRGEKRKGYDNSRGLAGGDRISGLSEEDRQRHAELSKRGNPKGTVRGAATRAKMSASRKKLWDEREDLRLLQSERWSGEGNPMYVHGNGYAPYTSAFKEKLKASIRERDGHQCQRCGRVVTREADGKAIPVHHIDGDKANCEPTNLCCLCASCNSREPRNRAEWAPVLLAKVAARYERLEEILR